MAPWQAGEEVLDLDPMPTWLHPTSPGDVYASSRGVLNISNATTNG